MFVIAMLTDPAVQSSVNDSSHGFVLDGFVFSTLLLARLLSTFFVHIYHTRGGQLFYKEAAIQYCTTYRYNTTVQLIS